MIGTKEVTVVAQFVEVCSAEEVIDGQGLAVDADGLRIALFLDNGQYHALLGHCPHANGELGQGWIEDGEAVCPLHHWRFKLATGRCTTAPGQNLHRFRCEIRNGKVWVEV
jgi:nitrite reductase (NADH) small subunit